MTLRKIQKWITSASDALDKDYLRELYLIFSKIEEPDVILESYKFQFKYIGNQTPTRRDLRTETQSLFEAISFLDQHEQLDRATIDIKMAVTYYENETPIDYHPLYFETEETSGTSILKLLSSHSKNYFPFGILQTGFHTLKSRGKADIFNMDKSSDTSFHINDNEREADNNQLVEDHAFEPPTKENMDNDVSLENRNCDIVESTEESQYFSIPDNVISISDDSIMSNTNTQLIINCSCGISSQFDAIDLIECGECMELQHCVCEGYFNSDAVESKYKCKQCKFPDIMTESEFLRNKLKAIYRLAIVYAHLTKDFPEVVVEKLSENIKERLLKKFIKDNIIQSKHQRYVNTEIIETRYLKGFKGVNSCLPDLPNSIDLCVDDEQFDYRVPLKKQKRGN